MEAAIDCRAGRVQSHQVALGAKLLQSGPSKEGPRTQRLTIMVGREQTVARRASLSLLKIIEIITKRVAHLKQSSQIAAATQLSRACVATISVDSGQTIDLENQLLFCQSWPDWRQLTLMPSGRSSLAREPIKSRPENWITPNWMLCVTQHRCARSSAGKSIQWSARFGRPIRALFRAQFLTIQRAKCGRHPFPAASSVI